MFGHIQFLKLININEYLSCIKKKFFRLMPYYFIVAGLILLAKLFLVKYFFIKNSAQGFNEFWEIIYKPTSSYAVFLWYVYVLFEYYFFPYRAVFIQEQD